MFLIHILFSIVDNCGYQLLVSTFRQLLAIHAFGGSLIIYSVTIQQQFYQMVITNHYIVLPFSSSSTKWLLYITIYCYHLVAALPNGYYISQYIVTIQQQLYQMATIYHYIVLPFSSSSTRWLLQITIQCYQSVVALPNG